MPSEGETIDVWRCEECGELLPSPAREHRHAEGAGGHGVYYPVVRLRLRVEQIADVAYEGGEWIHTPRPSAAPAAPEQGSQDTEERLRDLAAALALLREAVEHENAWRAGELADRRRAGATIAPGEYDPLPAPVAVIEVREAQHSSTPTSSNTRLEALARRADGTEAPIVYTRMHLAATRLEAAEDEAEVCWLDETDADRR